MQFSLQAASPETFGYTLIQYKDVNYYAKLFRPISNNNWLLFVVNNMRQIMWSLYLIKHHAMKMYGGMEV
jgi:hypothetical protein